MFPARNISIGARADRRHARLGMIERRCFQRAEGWIARRGDFLLPAFVCFFGAFFSQEKKAEFLKLKIAQEITLQIRRFAGEGQCRGRGLPRRSALAMTDTGNANRREMGRFFACAQNDRAGCALPPSVILRRSRRIFFNGKLKTEN